MAAVADTPFVAAVSTHPAMVDPKDGPSITIPYCLLPSMHEDKDAVKAFADAIRVEKYVKIFDDMPHVSSSFIRYSSCIGVALMREIGLDGCTVGISDTNLLDWLIWLRQCQSQ